MIDEALLLALKADYEQGVAKAQEEGRNAQAAMVANRGAVMAMENLLNILRGQVVTPQPVAAPPPIDLKARMKALVHDLAPQEASS